MLRKPSFLIYLKTLLQVFVKFQKMNTKSQSRFRENQASLKTKENDNRWYGNHC